MSQEEQQQEEEEFHPPYDHAAARLVKIIRYLSLFCSSVTLTGLIYICILQTVPQNVMPRFCHPLPTLCQAVPPFFQKEGAFIGGAIYESFKEPI